MTLKIFYTSIGKMVNLKKNIFFVMVMVSNFIELVYRNNFFSEIHIQYFDDDVSIKRKIKGC